MLNNFKNNISRRWNFEKINNNKYGLTTTIVPKGHGTRVKIEKGKISVDTHSIVYLNYSTIYIKNSTIETKTIILKGLPYYLKLV